MAATPRRTDACTATVPSKQVQAAATVGAILAIGIGGGAVKPMQARWERILDGMERETSRQVAAYQQGRSDAMKAPAQQRAPQAADARHAMPAQGPRPPQPAQPARYPRDGQL